MGAKVTNVSATNAILLERPALAAFTEALPDAAKIADFAAVSAGAVLEIPSQRPVLTPSFEPRAEAALNTTLREVAAGLPGARGGVVAIGEFRGPWGVPDLVALAPSRVGQRLSCAVPPLLSQHDCRLVAAAGRWMEPAALAAAAKVSQNAAERYIRRLTSIGALEIRRGRLKRAAGMVPLGRQWAIEAKVDDWRAGLSQVHRYRLWADGAVLVLGRARVPTETIAEQARLYRVGLVVDGRWVTRPKAVLPDDATRLHASEHILAALIGAPPTSRS